MPVDSGGGVLSVGVRGRENIFSAPHPYAMNPTATTHGHFVLSPISLASRDQDGGPSNSTIGIYDLTEK